MAAWKRHCLMFRTGALCRTGGYLCPSATGHLADFNSAPLLYRCKKKRKKKSMEVWRCKSVRALQWPFPRRISSLHLITKPWFGRLVCCVQRGPGDLISSISHRCPAAPSQTMNATHHNLMSRPAKNQRLHTFCPSRCPSLS